MLDRDTTRVVPDIDDEEEEDGAESGAEAGEKKDPVFEKKMAGRRAEGEAREARAKASIVEVRKAALRSAGGVEKSGLDFCLAGERRLGGEAAIGVKTTSGEIRTITITEALKVEKEKAALLSFRYGESLRVTLEGQETKTATVIVPLDLKPNEFPFLIREVVRALGALETHLVQKESGGGKKQNGRKSQKKYHSVDEPTVQAKIIREEIEKQKKLEDGFNDIQKDFYKPGTYFPNLRDKYRKLETAHSSAWCSAEGQVNRLMEGEARVFNETTGFSLYDAYGSEAEFKKEQLRRTWERQQDLIYPYDENRLNLLMLGRPALNVEKAQYITMTGLLTGSHFVRKAIHGKNWDIPIVRRFTPLLRDSTMVTSHMLRRKIRGYNEPGGSDDPFVKKMGLTGVDIAKTYGAAALGLAGGAAILGLAAAVELPFRAAGAGVNWLDQLLYGWQKKLGGMVSKNYKPGRDTLADKEKKEAEELESLKKKALGKQEDKGKKDK